MVRILIFILVFGINSVYAAVKFQVIASNDVTAKDLTRSELTQILLANSSTWPDGKKATIVYVTDFEAGANDIHQYFLSMTTRQLKKHYLAKAFSGAFSTPPIAVDSSAEAVTTVVKTPGSVALINVNTDSKHIKVINLK